MEITLDIENDPHARSAAFLYGLLQILDGNNEGSDLISRVINLRSPAEDQKAELKITSITEKTLEIVVWFDDAPHQVATFWDDEDFPEYLRAAFLSTLVVTCLQDNLLERREKS